MKGCCLGKHSDDPAIAQTAGSEGFWRSSTVENASNAVEKDRIAQLKTAADFNKEQEVKKAQKIEAEVNQSNKKPVMTKDGTKFMCANKGCVAKSFVEANNNDTACQHHVGEPVFHDLKKYWSCCT